MTPKRIFPAAPSLAECEAAASAHRDDGQKKGLPYAGPEVYRDYYDRALKRLDQIDILPLESAAELMALTPDAYVRKADRGQAILIEIEGQSFVPRFTLDTRYKNARIKPFHLAIAQEFAEGHVPGFFKFMSYLQFMNEKMEISAALPERRLPEIFKVAGVSKGDARVILNVPMTEIADRAVKNPQLMASFINKLGPAVSEHGGHNSPSPYGLSDEFLSRYVPADMPHRDRWKREIS